MIRKQIDDQGRLRAKSEHRTVNHTTLTENIGATVNDLSIDHRRMEETLLDQHRIIKDIHLDTQGIIGREASLMQRIQSHSEEIRNHMKSCTKQQEQLVGAQDESLLRIQTSCQEIRHQAETLEALERMMAAYALSLQILLFFSYFMADTLLVKNAASTTDHTAPPPRHPKSADPNCAGTASHY